MCQSFEEKRGCRGAIRHGQMERLITVTKEALVSNFHLPTQRWKLPRPTMLLASEVIRQGWLPWLLCSQKREKYLQKGFCFILKWVDRNGGMTHLLGLHLCLYSLWRKLSDELSQSVQSHELHETSHTQSTCGKPGGCWKTWGPATTVFRKFRKFAAQTHLKPKILTPSVFSIPIWVWTRRRCWRWASSQNLSPKPFGLVERNLAAY